HQQLHLPRIFEDFDDDTRYFGFYLQHVAPSNVFEITATGLSGTASFQVSGNGYYAVGDIEGFTQVIVTNLGTDGGFLRFTFDDVITGRSLIQAVPAPGALALFALGSGGAVLFPRRRVRLSA
ncbi:MAG TPA: hypothetical protein VIK87_05820, partial [Sphingomonadales bacterium]